MNHSKTLKTRQPSFSLADDGIRTIHLHAPSSWSEMTQKQLRYTLYLLSQEMDKERVKTYMFIRFTGIEVIGRRREGWKCVVPTDDGKKVVFIDREQIASLLQQFDYIDTYEDMGVRLDSVQGLHAVDILLHGVAFIDYLNAEKAYQGYLISKDLQPALSLVRILYRDKNGNAVKDVQPDAAEILGTVLWYSYIKQEFNKAFPNFFKPISATYSSEGSYDVVASINVQIRALTDGDITKEDIVLHKDCWRALTELDAKAREAAEMKRIMNRNKIKANV